MNHETGAGVRECEAEEVEEHDAREKGLREILEERPAAPPQAGHQQHRQKRTERPARTHTTTPQGRRPLFANRACG